MSYPNTQLLIDGQWQDAADGRTLPVFNPATGAEIGRVAHAGIADLDRALAAAQKGFEAWRDVPAIERGRIMRRAAGLMRERADGIAALLTQETASRWPRRRSRRWPPPTSSSGSPTRACASMAASCRPATRPCASWW
jgi:acyl-CoA reductase-like NAD-dependent aldehyde dehydrogenase